MERNHLEGLGVDRRIILKWIAKNSYVKIVNINNFLVFNKATCFNLFLIGHHKLNICNIRFKKEVNKNALLFGNLDLSFTERSSCLHYKYG
jgi:hypothetical protein